MERQENMGKDGLLHCSVCGEPTQKILPFPLMDGSEGTRDMKVHIMCSCEKKERDAYDREQKRQEEMRVVEGLRKLSLMDDKLSQARLESFTETDDNARLLKIVRNYIVNFEKMYEDNQGLLLWGPVGTGKSYAAAVIANELLDRRTSVVMTSFIKILKEVGTFDDDNGKIDKMNQSKLLIIDDLGAERGTDYSLERVYDIIDSRYRSNKPIILTTNLTMEQMKNCEDMALYKKEADNSSSEEAKRRYRELHAMYIDDEAHDVKEIAEMENISEKIVYRDIGIACKILAVYLLGM